MAKTAQYLCEEAARILRQVDNGAGLRQLLYKSPVSTSLQKPFFALVNGVYNEKPLLQTIAKESGLVAKLPAGYDETVLLVLLYEVLLGTRRIRGEGPLVEAVKAHKSVLQQTLANRRKQGLSAPFTEKIHLPRFCRVNGLKTTHKEAEKYVAALGLNLVKRNAQSSNTLTVNQDSFMWDPLVPDLLVLPARTNLHADAWVEQGKLVLQDRSSCLSAWALSPPPGSYVIDGCAAPGNKTMQLASLMKAKGQVFAMERSPDRLEVLKAAIAKFGAKDCVSAVGMDFMDIDLQKYAMVSHVLLDPTCSGSGLVAQYSAAKPLTGEGDATQKDARWLAKLSAAQTALILKAMSLPNVKVVVYSTCSIHREENEDVVERVIAVAQDFICVPCLPQWPHRGLVESKFGSMCARASYQSDSTNGFFVARFERESKTGELVAAPIQATEKMRTKKKDKKPKEDVNQSVAVEAQKNLSATLLDSQPTKKRKTKAISQPEKTSSEVKPRKEKCKKISDASSTLSVLTPQKTTAKSVAGETIKKKKKKKKKTKDISQPASVPVKVLKPHKKKHKSVLKTHPA